MWQFQRTKYQSAFEASYAVLLLEYKCVDEMARDVARYAQLAAHHKTWERRKDNVAPMLDREREAARQLVKIVERL